jgi:hypothetical protein
MIEKNAENAPEKSQTPVEKFWDNFENSVNVDLTKRTKNEEKISDYWDKLVNEDNEQNQEDKREDLKDAINQEDITVERRKDSDINMDDLEREGNYGTDSIDSIKKYESVLKEGLIRNKEEGIRRENEVENELRKKYPESEGYKIEKEVFLLDKDEKYVKDPVTGERRRIDFAVIKDGKVVALIEVTSKTANKDEQMAKENRIREAGGNYIKDSNGNLVKIPENVHTQIERRN